MNKNKKLTIIDLMALATIRPELFTKQLLALVLNIKKTIMDKMFNDLMKEQHGKQK